MPGQARPPTNLFIFFTSYVYTIYIYIDIDIYAEEIYDSCISVAVLESDGPQRCSLNSATTTEVLQLGQLGQLGQRYVPNKIYIRYVRYTLAAEVGVVVVAAAAATATLYHATPRRT